MTRPHFSEEQIACALRQAESGTAVAEVCRQLGASVQHAYRLAGCSRTAWYRPMAAQDQTALRMHVKRRKHLALHRWPAPIPTGRGQRWSMDFAHDALMSGRPFRVLTTVDQWRRESPLLEVAYSLTGKHVVGAFEDQLGERGLPKSLTVDHDLHPLSRVDSRSRCARSRGVERPSGGVSDTDAKRPSIPVARPRQDDHRSVAA